MNSQKGSVIALGRRRASRFRRLLGAALVLLCLLALDLSSGAADLSWAQLWQALTGPAQTGETERFIVWELRLPQALTAIVAGAMLALLAGIAIKLKIFGGGP